MLSAEMMLVQDAVIFVRYAFRRRQADGHGPRVTCVRWVDESA